MFLFHVQAIKPIYQEQYFCSFAHFFFTENVTFLQVPDRKHEYYLQMAYKKATVCSVFHSMVTATVLP